MGQGLKQWFTDYTRWIMTSTNGLKEMNSLNNYSIGIMEEAVNRCEGEKQKQINEAEGKAAEILAISRATANSIQKIAETLSLTGGDEAVQLQLMEQFLDQLGKAATKQTQVILPLDLTSLESIQRLTKNDSKISATPSSS